MVWFWNSNTSQPSESASESLPSSSSPNTQYEYSTRFQSYSTSKSCVTDDEDPEYMICKETVNDGKNNTVKETRVRADEGMGMGNSILGTLFGGLDQSSRILQDGFSKFESELNKDVQQLANVFMPFFLLDPSMKQQFHENKKTEKGSSSQRCEQPKYSQQYFNTSEKDYQIKDL